ncbi:MAG: adenosylmethionine--8-amino-7-oxononanoate transaminase [Phycisphaerales bacterium]
MPPLATDHDAIKAIDTDHVWHPFTPMRWWRDADTLTIERADGFRLFDTEGRGHIDGNASLWCNVHGHRVRELDAALTAQLDRVAHTTMLGLTSVPATDLAKRLVAIAPGEMRHEKAKVFYSDAGATAVEVAMKIARGHHWYRGDTQRDTFIGIHGAYHGDTSGSMSIGFDRHLHDPFKPLTFPCQWATCPAPCMHETRQESSVWPSRDESTRARSLRDALADMDRLLDQFEGRVAGVVIEPLVQGAAGIVEHPNGYLRAVAEMAKDRGALLIADEVAVGFGRTGAMFACEHEDVTPDILCLGKGISGGYLPLAATIVREGIASSFDGEHGEYRTLFHGHTYTGNPLACATAIASLDLFQRDDVLANANRIGAAMRSRIERDLASHPNVADVRGRGVMIGVELVRSRSPFERFDRTDRVAYRVCDLARERGAIVRPIGDVLILNPAPAMDGATAMELAEILVDSVNAFDFNAV